MMEDTRAWVAKKPPGTDNMDVEDEEYDSEGKNSWSKATAEGHSRGQAKLMGRKSKGKTLINYLHKTMCYVVSEVGAGTNLAAGYRAKYGETLL